MLIIQVTLELTVEEVGWIHLNHLLLVHPQLVHLQPVAWTQNSVSGNHAIEFSCMYCIAGDFGE